MSVWLTDLASIATRFEGVIDHAGDDEGRLQAIVDEAEVVLTAHVPDLVVRVASGLVSADAVRTVLTAAVLRAWRNPGGLASESAGEVSVRQGGPVSDSVAFTSRELALVTGGLGRRRGTIGLRPAAPFRVPR